MRPSGASAARPRASAADGDFGELLDLAHDGAIESAREPELADGASLEPSTVAQLARALDLAEARGARRSVVVAEGRAFVADVQSRRLERLESRDDFVFAEVDSAIAIRAGHATFAALPAGPRALPPPGVAGQIESILEERARGHRASA